MEKAHTPHCCQLKAPHPHPPLKKTTASNVPIVAIDVTSLSLTGNRDWVLCIEYEVFI